MAAEPQKGAVSPAPAESRRREGPAVNGRPVSASSSNHGAASQRPESRTRVLDLPVGLVENLWQPASSAKSPEGFCRDFQICLPYAGLFVWHVGKDDVVGDPNQVVFVRGGEAYQMSSPSRFGYAELIVTPEIALLSEIAHANGRPLFEHPLFKRRAVLATPELHASRARFSRWLPTARSREPLEAEEVLVGLIRAALRPGDRQLERPQAGTARVIRRAKEVLHDRLTERLRLADVSRTVGVSPAYLTSLFTRTEGIPLHRYLTRLRLARALHELPHASDLTVLALDLGFSSHSHFTFAFRREFGRTPSVFRGRGRRQTRSRRSATLTLVPPGSSRPERPAPFLVDPQP